MRLNRGQTTIEMIVVVGLILLLFSTVLVIAHRKTVESNNFKLMLDAKRVAQSVADNINTIAEQGPGYYRHFTLTPYLFGGHEYNISIYGNFVEITWEGTNEEQRWSTQVVTANVTEYCLDKGGDTKNKVFNYDERILLTCNRADIMVVEGSFKPGTAVSGTDVTVSIDVLSYGVLDVSEKFNVTFTFINSSWWSDSREIDGLMVDKTITVNATIPSLKTGFPAGDYNVVIYADPGMLLNESYTGDNLYNATLTITV